MFPLCLVFAGLFPREVTTENTWKDAADPEFKQESTTSFAFKTPTKTFKTLAKPIKRLQIRKSGSNVFFLSCRGRARWSITPFWIWICTSDVGRQLWSKLDALPCFQIQKKHMLTYIGLIAIATAYVAESTGPFFSGNNQIAYFFGKRLVSVVQITSSRNFW